MRGERIDFEELVRERHSVRTYLDQRVEDEKIAAILEAARLAPSARNAQPWRYIVIKDKQTITELADTGRLNSWIKSAPVIVVACADPSEDVTNNGMDYFLLDVGISMEHLVLQATELGLGTCWLAGYNEEKVKAVLGVPKGIRVVAMTPLGYPAEKPSIRESVTKTLARSKNRKPLDEIVRYNKW